MLDSTHWARRTASTCATSAGCGSAVRSATASSAARTVCSSAARSASVGAGRPRPTTRRRCRPGGPAPSSPARSRPSARAGSPGTGERRAGHRRAAPADGSMGPCSVTRSIVGRSGLSTAAGYNRARCRATAPTCSSASPPSPSIPPKRCGFVADPGAGGTVLFSGTVRDHSDAGDVTGLDYEAWEERAPSCWRDRRRDARRWPVRRVALLHRIGRLAVGEISVLVGCSAPHRAEAFEAAATASSASSRTCPSGRRRAWPRARRTG